MVLQGECFAEIFTRYERGETLKVIADSLNKRGFRTRGAEINRIAALQDKEDTTLPALREQLKKCEKNIENMRNAIQMSILTASAKTRLKEPEARQNELKLSIMQAELQKPKYTKEQIVSCINRFKYGDEDDIEYQKQIIDTFINAICVFDDKLVFTYNFQRRHRSHSSESRRRCVWFGFNSGCSTIRKTLDSIRILVFLRIGNCAKSPA